MKAVYTLTMATLAISLASATIAIANAEATQCTQIRNICNGGYCRTVIYDNAGGVTVSDLWKEQTK